MSTDAGAPSRVDVDTARIDFDYYRDIGRSALEEMARKIDEGRVRSESKEAVRIKRAKALFYGIDTMRKLEESRTLNELSDEVEALKGSREVEEM